MDIDGLERWHFELTERACNELLGLVLEGRKRATSSSLASYRLAGEDVPREGELSVICDWDGNARCVVRTTRVEVVPFRAVTLEMARREGEDDSLASWRENHERYFREEGKDAGYAFTDDMDVVFEDFEVVEVLGAQREGVIAPSDDRLGE